MIMIARNGVGRHVDGKDLKQKGDPVQNPLAPVLEILTRQGIDDAQESATYAAGNTVRERVVLQGDEIASWGGPSPAARTRN